MRISEFLMHCPDIQLKDANQFYALEDRYWWNLRYDLRALSSDTRTIIAIILSTHPDLYQRMKEHSVNNIYGRKIFPWDIGNDENQIIAEVYNIIYGGYGIIFPISVNNFISIPHYDSQFISDSGYAMLQFFDNVIVNRLWSILWIPYMNEVRRIRRYML